MKKEIDLISKNKQKEIERELLHQEEQQMLFQKTESYRPEYIQEKEAEIYFLTNGTAFSRQSIEQMVKDSAGEYFPMFPNNKPFFRLMYKLNGWDNLNPDEFVKPPIVGIWIKAYIYRRFEKWVLDELIKKENPIIQGYVKKYKLFQFLDERGQMLMEGYIQDAIDVMQETINASKDWYEFEKTYTKRFKLSVQLRVWQE